MRKVEVWAEKITDKIIELEERVRILESPNVQETNNTHPKVKSLPIVGSEELESNNEPQGDEK